MWKITSQAEYSEGEICIHTYVFVIFNKLPVHISTLYLHKKYVFVSIIKHDLTVMVVCKYTTTQTAHFKRYCPAVQTQSSYITVVG